MEQIKLIREELKNINIQYKEKERSVNNTIIKDFNSKFNLLEAKLAKERKELNNINYKLNKDRTRVNHLDLSTLKTRKIYLNTNIKEIVVQLKKLTKEREKAISKKMKEIGAEKEKIIKDKSSKLMKLTKEYKRLAS